LLKSSKRFRYRYRNESGAVLTRQGVGALVAGAAALIIGRVFAVLELFVIGSAFFVAALTALLFVVLRRPRVEAVRWIHPSVLVAGDTGRVDLHLRHLGRIRSTAFELSETVRRRGTPEHEARLPVGSLAGGARSSTGYQLPTSVRGVIELGPLTVETQDPLGMARTSTVVVGVDEVAVAPRAYLLDMPQLGQGILGNHLLNQARRLGPGDFHGLRKYVDGDEPRSIHWKASARSEDLLVKEHTVEGIKRCTVVFDALSDSYLGDASFERGITAAASLVHSAERSGLTTRFVTAGGIDLRGPDVAVNTLRILARITPMSDSVGTLDRDPGEGLGLLIVISGGRQSAGRRSIQSVVDPTLTLIDVSTDERARSGIGVSARTEDEFLDSWQLLTGQGRLDLVEAAS
jgi:uncharacterized protein (DUF58 family)